MQNIQDHITNSDDEPDQAAEDQLNYDVTLQEVARAVARAKVRKAVGIDQIPAEVLKNPNCVSLLHKIIQECFTSGIVPDDWMTGIIHPIFKDGDRRNPLHYRAITLISVPCKVYCDILNTRLSSFLETNSLFSPLYDLNKRLI